MRRLIAQNKYKLMAFIVLLYLGVDLLTHKGQLRVLFPKSLPAAAWAPASPGSLSSLDPGDKKWSKGVNSIAKLQALPANSSGFECDLYFDSSQKVFYLHHDPDEKPVARLDQILDLYKQRNMKAGIWLDIKNLQAANTDSVLHYLVMLRSQYNLKDKILVESHHAEVLSAFSVNGFFTSYYVPMFNPYKIERSSSLKWADSLNSIIRKTKINALSGYYFQTAFLNHYFPDYPVLTWIDKDQFSLVNRVFRYQVDREKSIFISLYP